MIKIRSAYLVGVDIWQTKNANVPFTVARVERDKDETIDLDNPSYGMIATGKISGDGKLISFIGDDTPISSRMIWKSEQSVPSFWTDKVVETYLDSLGNVDYLVWEAFIKLNPEAISQLVSLNDTESRRLFTELFGAVFPCCTGEHVGYRKYDPWYSFVLYIEPETAYSANYISISDYAADILALLMQTGGAPQPHHLMDVVLTHSIGAGVPSETIAAVGLEPLKAEPWHGDILLPKTVLDLVAYFAYAIELRHLSKRLRNLPFYTEPFKDYVMGLRKNRTLVSNYQNKFLEFLTDREQEISERLLATQTLDEIHRQMENNQVSKYSSTQFSTIDIATRVGMYSYDVFETFVNMVPKAERNLRETIEVVHQRADALSDFLRDMSTTDATKANLSLQRRILYFTIAVTIVVIVTLIITWPGVP